MSAERVPPSGLDPSARLAVTVVLSLVVWFGSLIVATLVLNREPASRWLRGAMVLLAVLGFAAWMWSSFAAIRAQDEFTQRLHLIALAAAFAVNGLAAFAADFMQRAGFVDYVPATSIWMVMVLTWWISMAVTHRLHR